MSNLAQNGSLYDPQQFYLRGFMPFIQSGAVSLLGEPAYGAFIDMLFRDKSMNVSVQDKPMDIRT